MDDKYEILSVLAHEAVHLSAFLQEGIGHAMNFCGTDELTPRIVQYVVKEGSRFLFDEKII